jgi:hypothetical protein
MFSPKAFFILLAAGLCACQSQTATEKTTDAPTIGEATATPRDTDITATTMTRDVTYQRRLVNQNYAISVTVQGAENTKDLQIEVLRGGKLVTEFTESIDGQVAGSMTTDLNKNNRPEVLVFVESSGSGSYGLVYGYELSESGKNPLTLPPLKGDAAEGYMGHDTFKVENGKLLRTFPVYADTDANASPTGGTRTLTYTLGTDLVFALEKTI